MFCTKCGNKIEDGRQFCPVCGTPVRPQRPAGAVPPGGRPAGPAGAVPPGGRQAGPAGAVPPGGRQAGPAGAVPPGGRPAGPAGIVPPGQTGGGAGVSRFVKPGASNPMNMKVILALAGVVMAVILIVIITQCAGGGSQTGVIKDYVENMYNGTDVQIVEFDTATEEEVADLRRVLSNPEIKEAIYDVEVSYNDEYGYQTTYLDIVYKDDDGWHVWDL